MRHASEPRTSADILKEARAAAPHFHILALADGEPTLVPNLPDLLGSLTSLPVQGVQVHTNARMFAYRKVLAPLGDIPNVNYVVRLYSHKPETHDALSRTPGSAAQTIRGLSNLLSMDRGRIGVFVEIPLARVALCDLVPLARFIDTLEPDGILLTGGYPAFAAVRPGEFEALASIESVRNLGLRAPMISFYAEESRYAGQFQPAWPCDRSQTWFAGALTNNPFVFRKQPEDTPGMLLVSLPYKESGARDPFMAAPYPLGALNSFMKLLGTQCDLVDLQALAVCGAENAPETDAADRNPDALRDYCRDLIAALPRELSQYALVGLSMVEHLQRARGLVLAELLNEFVPRSRIAIGFLRENESRPYTKFAAHIFRFAHFGEYYLGGLMNRLTYGDRCDCAIFGSGIHISAAAGKQRCDLSWLPDPDFEPLDLSPYARGPSPALVSFLETRGEPPRAVQTGFTGYYLTLGCAYACAYCAPGVPLMARDPVRAAQSMLHTARATGLDSFVLLDPCVNSDRELLQAFCRELMRSEDKIYWSAAACPDFTDEREIRDMAAAGCVMLTMAVESGSDAILRAMRKNFTVSGVELNLDWMTRAGITTQINLMTGFIGERLQDVHDTLSFLDRNACVIDLIAGHTGFNWYQGLDIDHQALGVELRPGRHVPRYGRTMTYSEQGGRTWEQIRDHNQRAFDLVSRTVAERIRVRNHLPVHDLFLLYKLGLGRPALKDYAHSLSRKY